MRKGITRRALLAAFPASLVAAANPPARKTRPLPNVGEFFRFADPTTENFVVRLTNPSTTSLLPSATNRFISAKDRFLIFSSDRTGRPTPFHLDLRTGAVTEITRTTALEPASLCLDERQRVLYLLDGASLKEIALTSRRMRVLAEDVTAFSAGSSSDLVVIRRGRLEQLKRSGVNQADLNRVSQPLAEDVDTWCLVRPGGKGCLFGRQVSDGEREFWYAPLAPTNAPGGDPILLAKGRISNPFWSPDGQSLLLLRDVPAGSVLLSEIHEVFPETKLEQRVASTSQFATFAPNADGSVFVGASRSKAQPTVILLLRSPQRELTLCEHRASHPVSVSPAFSPDSRRIYFQSDHQGKSALYSVNVELLVEPTAPSAV